MSLRVVLLHVALIATTITVGVSFSWIDGFVVAGAGLIVQGAGRRLWAVAAAVLFTVSFPPYCWATWWLCLAPLVWIWREWEPKQSLGHQGAEAIAIGFAMGWLSTGFVRAGVPSWGWLLHGCACLVFSLQIVGIALAIRLMRNRPIVVAATLTALVAVGCEALQAWWGLVWSVTSLSLPLADTPVAQWARWVTPLGVAGILYWVNFLVVPDWRATKAWLRWLGPATAVGIAVVAWFGGRMIRDATSVEPMPFSVMLVQPHLKGEEDVPWRPWIELDRLTQASLDQKGPVDLIVWPESCLSVSRLDDPTSGPGGAANDFGHRLTLGGFSETLLLRYRTNCLLGVAMWQRGMESRYGLQVPVARRYNCGCLIARSGETTCHEKQALVPFREGLPAWLEQVSWVRGRVLPFFQLKADLTASNRFRLLPFRDQRDQERTIAVSICYEAFLFWLPQYRDQEDVDAIVHLVYDGVWHDHGEVIERQILACRYRAIETRKWNLVCSTWAGTTIIDPTGRIVGQLPTEPGVLRSDFVDRPVVRGRIRLGCDTPSQKAWQNCRFSIGGGVR